MDARVILYILGRLVFAETAVMGIPLVMAMVRGEASARAFLLSCTLAAFLGTYLYTKGRASE